MPYKKIQHFHSHRQTYHAKLIPILISTKSHTITVKRRSQISHLCHQLASATRQLQHSLLLIANTLNQTLSRIHSQTCLNLRDQTQLLLTTRPLLFINTVIPMILAANFKTCQDPSPMK
ncbi:BgTH12-04586 [Blumeria graminis f. sp. triticale]|uniref:BgTH12-04586 n=1 Tax=Blumeria graminis f. sp. triticale TaxID=1689686 RepID=A0A9W4D096_BLUGR|nr:BgTH12-04586 [Blumeria graminis f. sp. triticale]